MIIRIWCLFVIVIMAFYTVYCQTTSNYKEILSRWERSWKVGPASTSWSVENWKVSPSSRSWSVENQIPMTAENEDFARKKGGGFKVKKNLKKFVMPLLLAYKLKFFTLIPILVGGLLLLTATTGIAGFFFALFAASMGLKGGSYT